MGCEDGGIGLGFVDFLLGLLQFGAVLLQLVNLLTSVEFEDDVALFDGLAGMHNMSKLERVSTERRSREHHGVAGAKLAHRPSLNIDIAAFDLGKGNVVASLWPSGRGWRPR